MTSIDELRLLPTPRRVHPTGGTARRPGWLKGAADDLWRQACGETTRNLDVARIGVEAGGSEPEGYSIRIARGEGGDGMARIDVRHRDRAGLRHAAATLRQIVRSCRADLPCMEIQDGPAGGFATRGVMLDVSRDKVPTMAQLRESIDLLALLKFNHLQFYTEHTFAYTGHDEVWRDWSPLTAAQVRELDGYAAARGIELAANQNCFGHLGSWLKKPGYQHLAEIEGDGAWYFHQWERRGAFSLCPTEPRAAAFVDGLLDELLPCFASGLVNIGCDETFDVGWGRSSREVERRAAAIAAREAIAEADARERARAELYFEFVRKISAACASRGKRPMMWADIALTHPEMLHLLPRDAGGMIGLAWWYEPTGKFERWVGAIREAGHAAWVCPGTSSWRTFTGRTSERRGNIADAAEQGARAGATGFLVCDWGDMGHRQQWPIALAGIAQAAEAAWNPDRARAFDPRATGLHALGESAELGTWLENLGECDRPIRESAKVLNASALFNDLHPPVPGQLKAITHEVEAGVDAWTAAKERLLALRACRPGVRDELTRAELDHALECAVFAADHAVAMRDATALNSTRDDLIARCEAIRTEHERLWLIRNRPGGMASASRHYARVIDALRAAAPVKG